MSTANESSLDRAISIVQRAIDEDVKGNYAEALKLYSGALDYFMLARKSEGSKQGQQLIQSRIAEYWKRAATLKEHVDKVEKRHREATSANGGIGGAGKGTSRLAAGQSNLGRAISIVRRAIDEDSKGNFTKALKLYSDALDYFMLAHKYEAKQQVKQLIQSKVDEYLKRADALKEHVDKVEKRHREATSANGGIGGAGKETSSLSTMSMADQGNLGRAISIVRRAIGEDSKGNYAEALKLYSDALDYFMLAFKYEKNEQSKQLIRSKIDEYLKRADALKEHVDKVEVRHGNAATASANGGTGGAVKDTFDVDVD